MQQQNLGPDNMNPPRPALTLKRRRVFLVVGTPLLVFFSYLALVFWVKHYQRYDGVALEEEGAVRSSRVERTKASALSKATLVFPPGQWDATAQFVDGAYLQTMYRDTSSSTWRQIHVFGLIVDLSEEDLMVTRFSHFLDNYEAEKAKIMIEERQTVSDRRMLVMSYQGAALGDESLIVLYCLETPHGWITVTCISSDLHDQVLFDKMLLDVRVY